ncbi:DUF6427 family protein [Marinigracilibium pacificum]|uniref:Dolichyl-phosphate-mannose-protein mannosyltransferase n=1 Tax=Marinigracilibium pacificum TaxID=2729599 RepID=A0A848J138_9BACT|nr:DUF6427 family protein [Marinigracilibium pacificum]NMM46952.1 hypothetical protein [Marinigracilibium pacificum]
MLQFFRINDPYRFVAVFLLIVLIRLPFWLSGGWITLPEIEWLLIGEELANGKILYRELFDDIGPVSAYLYAGINALFGRTEWPLQVAGVLLTLFQAITFNRIALRNKAYNENTYIPGMIYAVCSSLFPDMYIMSPVMISMTFIMLATENIFNRIEVKTEDRDFLLTGVYLSIATMAYLPSIFFTVFCLISLVLFTGTVPRRYLLYAYGVALPLAMVFVLFLYLDSSFAFIDNFILSWWSIDWIQRYSKITFWSLIAVPVFFFTISVFKTFSFPRYTNYQVRLQQVMLIFFIISILVWVLSRDRSLYHLLLFVPPMAFFLSHYFLIIRRKWMAELQWIVFFSCVLFINYGLYYQNDYLNEAGLNVWSEETFLFKADDISSKVKGSSLLIIGSHPQYYIDANLATPYFNWDISEPYFMNTSRYSRIVHLYNSLVNDPPEIILDFEKRIPILEENLPILSDSYETEDGVIYKLKIK